jgi:hypothetical protein
MLAYDYINRDIVSTVVVSRPSEKQKQEKKTRSRAEFRRLTPSASYWPLKYRLSGGTLYGLVLGLQCLMWSVSSLTLSPVRSLMT